MMNKVARGLCGKSALSITAAVLALLIGWGAPFSATADEKDARRLVKAMSDYLAAQQSISFDYDANLEVVTVEKQKLDLASSGTVTLQRPDKIHTVRPAALPTPS